MTYDLIIIGGGPAGTAGAVYAARKQLKTLLIVKEFGGQSVVSETIYNWIGTPAISGHDLAQSFKNHVSSQLGGTLELSEGDGVARVTKNGDLFSVSTENGKTYETKTILVATGSARKRLTVPGADQFEHKGITYCASCDGPVFAGMDVAVIGGGNAGFESAAQLLAYCNSVTLLHHRNEFKADPVTVEKVLGYEKMTGIKNAELTEVFGDTFVEGLRYKDTTTGEIKELKVSGIFAEIGQTPATSYLTDVLTLDETGRVAVDPKTQASLTQGIWAAGDCTDGLYHQNNIATGDAVKALEDIYLYLKA